MRGPTRLRAGSSNPAQFAANISLLVHLDADLKLVNKLQPFTETFSRL
jgi:hypothetical protein